MIKTTFGAIAILALLGGCSERQPALIGGSTGAGGVAPGAPMAGAAVPGSEQDLVQNVGDRVFFAFDKSSVSPEAQATLDRQAEWLNHTPATQVQIAGNCDDRGTEEYNLALGQRRANAARDYLVARGVSSARINTISFGKDRPIALGDNEQAWAQNRNAITSVQNANISMR
ncbi:MAG: peptidoglycan-associated lipoprotein Pal [Acetobacteraceae bacterium]